MRGRPRPDISNDTSTGLFFEEETPDNSNSEPQTDGISCSDERYELADMLWGSLPNSTGNNSRGDDRYNESPGSVKRRRTSNGAYKRGINGPESAASSPTGNDGDGSASAREAPRLESEDSSSTPTIARHGPFVDDSDSEDDRSPLCVDVRDTNAGKNLEIGDRTTQPFPDVELPDDKRLEDSSCQSIDPPESEIGPGCDTPNELESTLVPDEDSGHLVETFSDDEVTVCPICQTSLSRLSDSVSYT